MKSIQATFSNGQFNLEGPVDWPDGTPVQITPLVSADQATSNGWPEGYFERIAGALAGEEFERPPQGELPQRDSW